MIRKSLMMSEVPPGIVVEVKASQSVLVIQRKAICVCDIDITFISAN